MPKVRARGWGMVVVGSAIVVGVERVVRRLGVGWVRRGVGTGVLFGWMDKET